jgi:hypothetical protein
MVLVKVEELLVVMAILAANERIQSLAISPGEFAVQGHAFSAFVVIAELSLA